MGKRLALFLSLLFALAACGDRAGVEASGFLTDRSQLKAGRGDQAQLVFIDPETDFSPYEKVLIDPVVVWKPTAGRDASGDELRSLAADFESVLQTQLQLEFDLVEKNEPGALRIRAALIGVRETGASIEMEILDAESGRRLAAVADSRESAAPPADGGKWAGAHEAFEFWATRVRVRLAALRSFDATEAEHDASSASDPDERG